MKKWTPKLDSSGTPVDGVRKRPHMSILHEALSRNRGERRAWVQDRGGRLGETAQVRGWSTSTCCGGGRVRREGKLKVQRAGELT